MSKATELARESIDPENAPDQPMDYIALLLFVAHRSLNYIEALTEPEHCCTECDFKSDDIDHAYQHEFDTKHRLVNGHMEANRKFEEEMK